MNAMQGPPPGWNGMTFQNGRPYGVDIRLTPPSSRRPPWIAIRIARAGTTAFKWIPGKLDTGASRTVLTLSDAETLGIRRPCRSALSKEELHAANKTKLTCYFHRVTLRVGANQGTQIQFPLVVGVAKKLSHTLFGFDWTWHCCLAIDATSVHLLRN